MHMNHNNNYSSSDLISWLNSRHYSHPKFKIVNIKVNFWEGARQLFWLLWVKFFQFLYIFFDFIEKFDRSWCLASISASSFSAFYAEIAKAKMEAKHQDRSNFSMKSKNIYKNWNNFTQSN